MRKFPLRTGQREFMLFGIPGLFRSSWFRHIVSTPMKYSCVFACAALALIASLATGAEPLAINIWPEQAPGETEVFPPEANITTPEHRTVDGRPATRMSNVVHPTITVFRPNPEIDTGAAVLVFPGGGYNYVVVDLEGSEVCAWLNSIGVTGIVLKYRAPAREGKPRGFAPLQDAQRAMGLVRQHAAEWGIDPDRVGVLGFSAGAHLAANLSNNHEERAYARIDDADTLSCRPDFAVLLYPGYLVDRESGNKLSPELTVAAGKTPPTFLAMTQDDPVHVENAVFYYLALHASGVPAELHLYPTGGHGYGLRPAPGNSDTWPLRVTDWLDSSGWLLTE